MGVPLIGRWDRVGGEPQGQDGMSFLALGSPLAVAALVSGLSLLPDLDDLEDHREDCDYKFWSHSPSFPMRLCVRLSPAQE